MGRVIVNGPPECGDERGWCLFCLMEAKQKQWELTKDDQEKGIKDSGDKLTVIPWLDGLAGDMMPGLYRAVCGSAPQLGVVDGLCWNHVAGIAPMHQAPLVNGEGWPVGLLRGRG